MEGMSEMTLARCRLMKILMVVKGIDFSVLLPLASMMDLCRMQTKQERPSACNVHGLCCVLNFWLMLFTNSAQTLLGFGSILFPLPKLPWLIVVATPHTLLDTWADPGSDLNRFPTKPSNYRPSW
jgi:hypothetical protein